jgi:hypothetical protein
MSNNLVPILFFGSFILIIFAAVVVLAFPKLNPFEMRGGGCGCKNNKFIIWVTGLLGFVILMYFLNTKSI